VINNETYYLVTGYAPGAAWIRQNDDGELFVLQTGEEKIAHLKRTGREGASPNDRKTRRPIAP